MSQSASIPDRRGGNRISASRLYDFSRVLDVPVSFFFDDMPDDVAAHSPRHGRGWKVPAASLKLDPVAKRETLELARAYYKISNAKVRQRVFVMVKVLAASFERS